MKLGVVSGLPRESACFDVVPETERQFKTYAGVGPDKAAEAARNIIAAGGQGLISFGVAGGLSEAAPAGSVVVADTVIDNGRAIAADEDWRNRILNLLGDDLPVVPGAVAGTDRMIPTPEGKREIHRMNGAVACDMESHALARVADEQGVPFVVIRAISDPHDRFVPRWVLRCVAPTGDVRMGPLIWQAARRPWAWANLARLGRDSGEAFENLRGVALRLGPGLGFSL